MTETADTSSDVKHDLGDLLGLLEIEQLEVNLFRAQNGPGSHVFGGQVLGQAIVAASRTVVDRQLHSFHSYFLRPGDSTRPILFDVDRIRDGSSFTTRRVVGIQKGRAIFNLQASFQIVEEGLDHQSPPPAVPPPDEVSSDLDYYRQLAQEHPRVQRFAFRYQVIDSRQVDGAPYHPRHGGEAREPRRNTWMRVKGAVGDDPVIHSALLGYMSDMDFMSTTMLPHGPTLSQHTLQGASLDHAMWFHRPLRADRWLLFVKESPSASGARGFVRGSFYQDGRLVASACQECLVRLRERL